MNPDEQEVKKLLLVKIGMVIVVAAVFFLWLANLQGVFESQKVNTDKTWKKISDDMNKSFAEAENRFDAAASSSANLSDSFVKELKDKASSTASSVAPTSTATSTEEIKKELTDLINTATTSPKRTDCPLYIDCMPSIGEARPCVIPVGCEKITQIAY